MNWMIIVRIPRELRNCSCNLNRQIQKYEEKWMKFFSAQRKLFKNRNETNEKQKYLFVLLQSILFLLFKFLHHIFFFFNTHSLLYNTVRYVIFTWNHAISFHFIPFLGWAFKLALILNVNYILLSISFLSNKIRFDRWNSNAA